MNVKRHHAIRALARVRTAEQAMAANAHQVHQAAMNEAMAALARVQEEAAAVKGRYAASAQAGTVDLLRMGQLRAFTTLANTQVEAASNEADTRDKALQEARERHIQARTRTRLVEERGQRMAKALADHAEKRLSDQMADMLAARIQIND